MKKHISASPVMALLLVSAMLFGCTSGRPENKIKNVLLISMDTTRADHLSCYGFAKNTTPHIDAFAAEATLFKNNFATTPLTMPSHSSMLTGTIPPFHGVHTNYNYTLAPSNVTLAEILKAHGYKTGAVVGTFVLDSKFGLDQGFDLYNDTFETTLNSIGINERGGGEASRLAMEWMETVRDERFFLFLHYYDPHQKYEPPEPFASRFDGDPYSGEIAYTDYSIGKVLKHLKRLGIYDSTLVIITGDHGEMLGEHNELTHSYYIYNAAVHVPLIIRLPDQKTGRTVNNITSLVDIVPTICSLLEIPPLPRHKGMDLSPYLLRDNFSGPQRYVFSESMTPAEFGANPLLGITAQDWRYLETTKPELYNLKDDPGETDNLFERETEKALFFEKTLKRMVTDQLREDSEDSKTDLDEESIRRLESLGYLAGSSSTENLFTFDRSGEDPKDMFPFYKECSAVKTLTLEENLDNAKAAGLQLVEKWPGKFKAWNTLGSICIKRKEYEEAVEHYRKSIRLRPDQSLERMTLARCLIELKQYDEALAQLEEAGRLNPKNANRYFLTGRILSLRGKTDQALKSFKKALRIRPDFPECYTEMAKTVSEQDRAKAGEYLKKALEIAPGFVKAHINLGLLYRKQHRYQEALNHYLRALKADPAYVNTYIDVGEALSQKGRFTEAAAFFTKALEIDQKNRTAETGQRVARQQITWKDGMVRKFELAMKNSPNDPRLHARFGNLIVHEKPETAIAHYRKALETDPENTNAKRNMAWLLATHADPRIRNSSEAIVLAEQACPPNSCDDPTSLDILAAAYAADGDYPKAERFARKALSRLAADNSRSAEMKAADIRNRLERYQRKTAYHDGYIYIPEEYRNFLETLPPPESVKTP